MDRENIKKDVINAYVTFTQKLVDRQYNGNLTDKELKMVDTFIDLVEQKHTLASVGPSFLYEYFAFQYDYWLRLDTEIKGRILVGWVLGKKAWKRFCDFPHKDLTKAHAHMRELKIGPWILSNEYTKRDFEKTTIAEEKVKQIFHNTESGYILCLESTTLFNDKSKLCRECRFKEQCKQTLRVEYPKIFLARGFKIEPIKGRRRRR